MWNVRRDYFSSLTVFGLLAFQLTGCSAPESPPATGAVMQLSGIREDVEGLVAFYRIEGDEAPFRESTECVKTGDSATCSFSSAPIAAKNALKLIVGSSACNPLGPDSDTCPWPLVYTNEQPLVGQGGNVQLKWDGDGSTSLTEHALYLDWPDNEGADSARVLFRTPQADGEVISFVGALNEGINEGKLAPVGSDSCKLFDNQSECWLPTPSQGGWVFDLRIYVEAESNWIEVSTVATWGGGPINADCPDEDADGYAMAECVTGEGGGDCDDTDKLIYPNAPELDDKKDNDCDEAIDENLDTTDDDEDGFSENDGDCNDSDNSIYPNAPELDDNIDNDCDEAIDENLETTDDDSDGFSEKDGDCNDDNQSISPNTPELCNEVDDDCDDAIDEEAIDAETLFADFDDDTYGNLSESLDSCPRDGYVEDSTDCDDEDDSVSPNTPEIPYDGIDQDCDETDLTDVDEDGYPSKVVSGDDCNDYYSEINPGSTDIPYDYIDQDCLDGDLRDVDGDGYDSTEVGGTDCDDTDKSFYPGAVEIQDGKDNNCDTLVDVCSDLNCDGFPDIVISEGFKDPGNLYMDSWIYWGIPNAEGECAVAECSNPDSSKCYTYRDCDRSPIFSRCAGANVIADLNLDGTLDVMFANVGGCANEDETETGAVYPNSVIIHMGDGTKNVENWQMSYLGNLDGFGGTPFGLAVANMDVNTGNRFPDIIVGASGRGLTPIVVFWAGENGGYSGSRKTVIESTANYYFCVADLNLDGFQDILVPSLTSQIFWGNGTQTVFTNTSELNASGYRCMVSDLDNDERPEIVIAGQSDTAHVCVFDAASESEPDFTCTIDLTTTGLSSLEVAKGQSFNGDGLSDIIFAVNGTSSLYFQDSFTPELDFKHTPIAFSVGPEGGLSVNDFNGDGHQDLVVGNSVTSLYLWNDSEGQFKSDEAIILNTVQGKSINSNPFEMSW